jgi:hypothetical protein
VPDRSFLAEAAEPVIRFGGSKKKFVDPEICSEYISAMARAGKVRYVLPRSARLTGRITEHDADGMQYFVKRTVQHVERREVFNPLE